MFTFFLLLKPAYGEARNGLPASLKTRPAASLPSSPPSISLPPPSFNLSLVEDHKASEASVALQWPLWPSGGHWQDLCWPPSPSFPSLFSSPVLSHFHVGFGLVWKYTNLYCRSASMGSGSKLANLDMKL